MAKTAPQPLATAQLIVLLHSQQLSAWKILPGLPPKALKIKGEERLSVRDAAALGSARADLAQRLRDAGSRIAHTLCIADTAGWQWCSPQAAPEATWLLPWEWLAQRFGLEQGSTPWDMPQTLETQILPWLITADDTALRQHLQQTRESEHVSETERLAAERLQLARDNEHLRAQNAALQQVDVERLVSFLPALYPRVFTVIGAADLTLLCGRVEPIILPSPYLEPTEETLRVLQKRFRALPQDLQKQIVNFVADLPQRQKLQLRTEMRDLVEYLTGL